jgi:DNA replication protein DnaC
MLTGLKQTEIQTIIPTSCDSKAISFSYGDLNNWILAIDEIYKDLILEKCIDLPKKLIEYGYSWSQTLPIKSLYLYGNYGSGKTSFAYAIIRELMKNYQGKGYFWPNFQSGYDLDKGLLKAIKSDGGDEYEISKWIETDLLFIDDLDKITASERFKNQFFEIIDKRMTKKRPTIITSNCNPEELSSIIGGAISSRIQNATQWQIIKFPDKDLRKTQTMEF